MTAPSASSRYPSEPAPAPTMPWVVCLCANWCGVCRDYRQIFERVAASHPDFRFGWLDVEDEADWLGDLDVETFPTVLVADDQGMRFLGPVMPHGAALSRLLESLHAGIRATEAAHTMLNLPQLLNTLATHPKHWVGR